MKNLLEFRMIMSEAKQLDENGNEPRPELNPLYVSDSSITNYNSP